MVRVDEFLPGELVHRLDHLLDVPSGRGEDKCRIVPPHDVHDAPGGLPERRSGVQARARAGLVEIRFASADELDAQVDLAWDVAVDDLDATRAAGVVVAAQETGDRLRRPGGGGQPDALERTCEGLDAFEAEREVGPPFRLRDRVDLVDDHPFDGPKDIACLRRGEHQVEGLGRGDQHVGRPAKDRSPSRRRRVTRANAYSDLRQVGPLEACRKPDPLEGGSQVPFDVVVEGLQR